jgi:hypothetical protein
MSGLREIASGPAIFAQGEKPSGRPIQSYFKRNRGNHLAE